MLTFSISGRSSELSTNYHPPIRLDENIRYCMALIRFYAFHNIPNIVDKKFYYDNGKVINIATGYYNIEDIEKYLQKALGGEDKFRIYITADDNIIKTRLKCLYSVDFQPEDSLRDILGFDKIVLDGGYEHLGIKEADFVKCHTIRIHCNLTSGSYTNEEPSHLLHEFTVKVAAGYPILEDPKEAIFLPVNTTTINNITLTLTDHNNKPVNFQNEFIQIRLFLKQWDWYTSSVHPTSIKKLHYH